MPSEGGRRTLPIPRPPSALRLVPTLVAGILGTGLLYQGATGGRLVDLLAGVPLFALGLWGAGWPFVLSMALVASRPRRVGREARPPRA
jgi:hypothetical protein